MKHPGLGLFRPAEAIVDQSLVGRLEEPFDLPLRELLPELRLFLRSEIPLFAVHFGFQLDMPVIQRVEHPAQNIEELIIAGLIRHFRSIGSVLLIPIDTPQPEERVSLLKVCHKTSKFRSGSCLLMPRPQGKIEPLAYQTAGIVSSILLENYDLSGDLGTQIETFAAVYTNPTPPGSQPDRLTFASVAAEGQTAQPSLTKRDRASPNLHSALP